MKSDSKKISKKQARQEQLKSLRSQLLNKDSPASSQKLVDDEYSSLHGQSQGNTKPLKEVAAAPKSKVKPVTLSKRMRKRLTLSKSTIGNTADGSSVLSNKDEVNPVTISKRMIKRLTLSKISLENKITIGKTADGSSVLSNKDNDTTKGSTGSDEANTMLDNAVGASKNKEVKKESNNRHQKLPPLQVKVESVPAHDFNVKVLENDPVENSFSMLSKYRVNRLTLKNIGDLGLGDMTGFQAKAIPALLEGRDILATLTPRCGKVLAYLIPALEILLKLKFNRQNGTGVIIILPTQELIRDIYDVIKLILKPHSFNCCSIMGANSREEETNNLREGVNIIVCTPGHLLHHMHNAPVFKYSNVQYVVVDEAQRIAELGFQYEVAHILKMLPKKRQTLLLTRNINERTLELARFCLKKEPFFVTADCDTNPPAATEALELQCMVCPTEKRFSLLYSFLRSRKEKKIVVLLASCLSAQYHYDILDYVKISCICIHGKQKHKTREANCSKFSNLTSGVLLCTNAAAVDIDISECDWVIQYEPPDEINQYTSRNGRLVGNVSPSTKALLLLRPEEASFVKYLRDAKVSLKQIKLPSSGLHQIESEIEPALKTMYFLYKSSRDGYMAFIKSYASHCLNKVFDVTSLDLVKVARSFGFAPPPYVDFDVHCKQVGKLIKRKPTDFNEKMAYAEKKNMKGKHLRFKEPKTA